MNEGHHQPEALVVDTRTSAHADLKPVALDAVELTDGFWRPRRDLNRRSTLRAQYQQLETTGRLDNFRRAAGQPQMDYQGLVFNDSDVYKWLEAAAWTLATDDDPDLARMVEDVIALIEAAQEPSGYLNTYFTFERAAERWSNLRDLHELYCAGHLFQAAVAHYRATGGRRLLDVARRFADLICETFGPGEEHRQGVPGHPEIEMGLVELARVTGDRRYLEQAAYFLNARGQGLIGGGGYHQDHEPFRDLEALTGHAVRAAYLSAGATDIYAELDDERLRAALDRLWKRMYRRQMYVTGGLGGRHQGDAIGADYELPNARAYAETCAGIANFMWAWRMSQLDGEPHYADVAERALYNAVLPGISLDGTGYYYVNPLATDGRTSQDAYRRQPWYRCACCPPNIARTLATVSGYLYSVSEDPDSEGAVWLQLYAANESELTLPEGKTVKLVQRTRYPWDGQIIVEMLTPGHFAVNVRIPAWCEEDEERYRPTVRINGGTCPGDVRPGQYVRMRRTWAVGDSVCIQLPMPVRRVAAHPYMLENTGRIALMRGPLLYCLEGTDHPDIDLRDVVVPPDAVLESSFQRELLGGVQVIEGEAFVAPPEPAWETEPYRTERAKRSNATGTRQPLHITAVPYFAWANREPGAMQVWLRES
ncbi:MAG: glycoside hydrolase family 127 protein [Anaerolineae bacterium]